jgi:hypothetical protein
MPKFTFPFGQNGLMVPVIVGLDGDTTTHLFTKGLPITPPVEARGNIDTGSTVTAVCPWVLQKLGIPPLHTRTTQTASGSATVRIFSVSIGIREALQPGAAEYTAPTVLVMELPNDLADEDVLIGLDVLQELNLLLEGPAKMFSLIF